MGIETFEIIVGTLNFFYGKVLALNFREMSLP